MTALPVWKDPGGNKGEAGSTDDKSEWLFRDVKMTQPCL